MSRSVIKTTLGVESTGRSTILGFQVWIVILIPHFMTLMFMEIMLPTNFNRRFGIGVKSDTSIGRRTHHFTLVAVYSSTGGVRVGQEEVEQLILNR